MKKKEKPVMGKALIIIGLTVKIAQIICVAAGVSEMGNAVWTAICACFLAGGAIVLGMERKKKTALFANIAAVGTLLSLIVTNSRVLPVISLFTVFVFFALVILTLHKKARIYGAAVLLLTAVMLLHMLNFITLPAFAVTVLLVAGYALIGAGIIAG